MLFQLMSLQVHLGLEHHKLLVQTLLIKTEEVVFLEMTLKGRVINVVLLLTIVGTAVTDMAAFVLLTTMGIKLIITIEPLPTETAFGMSFETALVDGTRLVIAILFVLS